MPNPLQPLLDRCSRGFTIRQKCCWTVIAVVYVICPIDLMPLIPIDDWGVLILLGKVLLSPTLPHTGDGGEGASIASRSREETPAMRRERVGGAR